MVSNREKSKYLTFFLSLLSIQLLCCICVLSLLDSPEYVRCKDLGIDAFLDLCAKESLTWQAFSFMAGLGGRVKYVPSLAGLKRKGFFMASSTGSCSKKKIALLSLTNCKMKGEFKTAKKVLAVQKNYWLWPHLMLLSVSLILI